MKYLSLVLGILIVIVSIYDSNSWEELRSNYLGLILGFGLLYKYYESHKSRKTAKKKSPLQFFNSEEGMKLT